jgi:hypothetical protein
VELLEMFRFVGGAVYDIVLEVDSERVYARFENQPSLSD